MTDGNLETFITLSNRRMQLLDLVLTFSVQLRIADREGQSVAARIGCTRRELQVFQIPFSFY